MRLVRSIYLVMAASLLPSGAVNADVLRLGQAFHRVAGTPSRGRQPIGPNSFEVVAGQPTLRVDRTGIEPARAPVYAHGQDTQRLTDA